MLTIVHGMPVWLPRTQPWVYWQILGLPAERIRAEVVCERRENGSEFPYDHVQCAEQRALLTDLLDRAIRRLGVRSHLRHLPTSIRGMGANALHSHFGDVGWRYMEAARCAGVPHVVTFYGYDVNLPKVDPVWSDRFHRLFETVSLVLCEGVHMGQCLVKLGCPPAKVAIQHLGVPLDKIPYRPRTRSRDEPMRVLIAATFTEKKGIPFALEALARIASDVRIQITIIGDARPLEEGRREKGRILRLLDETGLERSTRMLGYQPYGVLLREAYEHHVFLSPSVTASDGNTEGGAPVSLIDMAASGLPIVSSRHCDIPEIVLDGKTGLLADERDVDELASHLLALAKEPQRAHDLAMAARRHVEREYDARIQGARLASHYERIAGQCP